MTDVASKTAFVTGGTGFVGINLIHALVREGWRVVAVHRRSSNLEWLGQSGAELVVGDITDADGIREAMPEAPDVVFHVAGDTSFWRGGNAQQHRINVDGTRNVVAAALAKGAGRYVQTSSISAWAPADGDTVTEDKPSKAQGHWINYYQTKWLADEEVRAGIAKGLDAVIVAPGSILGPYDENTWGQTFRLLKAGKVPGMPGGSCTWNHVDGVVQAHLAAAERGKTGAAYLLSGPEASYVELTSKAAALLNVKPPKALPAILLRAVGRVSQWGSLLTKKAPDMTPELVSMLNSRFRVGSDKAERELGYKAASFDTMVEDSFRWLDENGRL